MQVLERLVGAASAGPLSLKELVRNSLRHSIGGVRFGERARLLPLPGALLAFTISPFDF